jgi:hypothetical protein
MVEPMYRWIGRKWHHGGYFNIKKIKKWLETKKRPWFFLVSIDLSLKCNNTFHRYGICMNCLIPMLVRSYRENGTVGLAKCWWKNQHDCRHFLFTAESVFQTKCHYKILVGECAWQSMWLNDWYCSLCEKVGSAWTERINIIAFKWVCDMCGCMHPLMHPLGVKYGLDRRDFMTDGWVIWDLLCAISARIWQQH